MEQQNCLEIGFRKLYLRRYYIVLISKWKVLLDGFFGGDREVIMNQFFYYKFLNVKFY